MTSPAKKVPAKAPSRPATKRAGPAAPRRQKMNLQRLAGTATIGMTDLCDLLGVSRYTVYRWMQSGHLPRPISPPRAHPRWSAADVMTRLDAAGRAG